MTGNKPHSTFPNFSFHWQNLVLSSVKDEGKSEIWEAHWSGCWLNTVELKETWWVPCVCCRLLAAMYVHYQFFAVELSMWPYLCMECMIWWLKGSGSYSKPIPSTGNMVGNGHRAAAEHKFTLLHIPSSQCFASQYSGIQISLPFAFQSFLLMALNIYHKSLFFDAYSQKFWTRRYTQFWDLKTTLRVFL